MSAPSHDDDQLKLEIFDSFSKTVMRNASRNSPLLQKQEGKMSRSTQISYSNILKHTVKMLFIHPNISSMPETDTVVSLQQNGCIRQCCCCRPNKRKWLF